MKTDRQTDRQTNRQKGRGKIERGRGKMTGRKERKKKIQLRLWVRVPQVELNFLLLFLSTCHPELNFPNPQPLAYMDKGTCAKGKPDVVGRRSGSYPVEEHCLCS